ncbi:hypothetical protein [Microbaculum marinum]|uniref:Uncharacterized protein n=1 Tax=Microbaculum marinum TaxID=1764581 RepID=A0AAW9S1E0_9HYPH
MALSFDDAVEIWIAKWRNEHVRKLCAVYDVDPRRLYEVWEEKVHVGSRSVGYARFKVEDPQLAAITVPEPHQPTLRVVKKVQPELFND